MLTHEILETITIGVHSNILSVFVSWIRFYRQSVESVLST